VNHRFSSFVFSRQVIEATFGDIELESSTSTLLSSRSTSWLYTYKLKMLSSLTKASAGEDSSSEQVRLPLVNQIRTMFIQTEDTPNPESLKFLPGRPVPEQPMKQLGLCNQIRH
jgi:hypothetical protein